VFYSYVFYPIYTGSAIYVTTKEAAPSMQPSPQLVALGPDVIEVSWSGPQLPNGLITGYSVFRRLAEGLSAASMVHDGDNETLTFIDNSPGVYICCVFVRFACLKFSIFTFNQ